MLNSQESEEKKHQEIQEELRAEIRKGQEEQGWLKKEMESISEVLITRNCELKELKEADVQQ